MIRSHHVYAANATPSSTKAGRDSVANSGFFKSFANPSFQVLTLLA
jgi:hypothetical protein